MTSEDIREVLESVRNGTVSIESATELLERLGPAVDIGDAMIDLDRVRRRGFPEVIYCESKSTEQIASIIPILLDAHGLAFGTRCKADVAAEVMSRIEGGTYNPRSRTLRFGTPFPLVDDLNVAVIAAGTSDLPVAEEACETLETFGAGVGRVYDVGVAGLHRLLARWKEIESASVLIVVAGMEGALPSVIGGLSRQPLIAVPTSIGYGAALGGFAAMFGMLTSCASGITVVNIDNGFGAAMAALSIVQAIREGRNESRVVGYEQP